MDDAPDPDHLPPDGVDDATVDALGKLSEAFEAIEQARGMLYGFHRLTGTADLALGEAVQMLREAGHDDVAERIETDLVGRNVLEGRWTFQVVEEYDAGYYAAFREHERSARDTLAAGRTHLYEARMKQERRTHGRRHHEAKPQDDSHPGA